MPNWRRHVREPAITALAVVALALVVAVGLIVADGNPGYLFPVVAGILGYGLAVGLAWTALASVFSWLLRRRQPWWSMVAGAAASLLIAAAAIGPLVVRLAVTDGWHGAPAQLAIGSAAGAIVAAAIVQTVVHLVLLARRSGQAAAELG